MNSTSLVPLYSNSASVYKQYEECCNKKNKRINKINAYMNILLILTSTSNKWVTLCHVYQASAWCFMHYLRQSAAGGNPGSSIRSWRTHSKDPQLSGDCNVARFNQVEICPWISRFPFPFILSWKKANCVFSKDKIQSSVQCFCFMLKLSPVQPVSLLQAHKAARLIRLYAWSKRECVNKWCVSHWKRNETERQRERHYSLPQG